MKEACEIQGSPMESTSHTLQHYHDITLNNIYSMIESYIQALDQLNGTSQNAPRKSVWITRRLHILFSSFLIIVVMSCM